MEDRIADFGAVLDDVLDKVAMSPPFVSGRFSAVDIALATRRDKILDALAHGVPPGTLARKFVEANAPFAAESIRLGIVRIRDANAQPSKSASLRRRDEKRLKESSSDNSSPAKLPEAEPAADLIATPNSTVGHAVASRRF